MKRGRDESEKCALTVILTGENEEYYCPEQVLLATQLNENQFNYCLKYDGTSPSQRRERFIEEWNASGAHWPFHYNGWRTGNALFLMDDFGEDISKFGIGHETRNRQAWFIKPTAEEKQTAVRRNNHAVIWINLSE